MARGPGHPHLLGERVLQKSVDGRGGGPGVTREGRDGHVTAVVLVPVDSPPGWVVEDHCHDPSCPHAHITQGCSENVKEKNKQNRSIELECLARPLPLSFPSKNPRRACSAIFGENLTVHCMCN